MNSKLNEDGLTGGIGTGLNLPGGYINGAPTGSVDETNNTQPSSKMRPEPHPTRHETEHPADEPDWYKKNNPYKSVSEILTKEEEDRIFEEFLDEYFSILEGTDSAWTDGFAVTGKEHNDTWEEFDNPEQGYTDMLPGWNVQGHLSDTLPKSIKDRVLPKDNHFEENGEMKRIMHPSKGEAYAQEKKERWEMNPMTTSEKVYAPHDEYKPVSIQEASNPIMDKEIPYTNSLGQPKKIKVKDALRLPRKHPAHIQAVKLIGPSDAPANEPKPKEEPGKAAQAAAKPSQPGQPVKKGQTAQGQIDKPSNNTPTTGEPAPPPPPQKLSGVELLSNAEKRAKKEKGGMNEGISESKQNSIQHFVEFATERLKLKEQPKVNLISGREYSEAKTSLGGYNPMTKEIFVVIDGRLTADICRTIAHEMVHRKQDELGLVRNEVKDGADGSPIENQAHAVAGILMREYGRINKEIYNEDINIDVDKGDTVLMGKFKNKKVTVKDFGKDDHGMPTINGKVATTFRMGPKGQNVFKKDETITENLLLEGGAAGHLAHPYEDSDLTFADMKEMINRGLIGGLDKEGPVSEKLDGQNIAFTVKNGQIRFGRNKGHVKNSGENSLDVKGIAQQFAGRGGIEKAFKNSSEDLQAAVKKLSPEQVNKMFGNGSKFMSLEIILPETQNVIPYGKNVLVMHGTIEYNKDGEQIGRSTEDAKTFAQEVQKIGADKQKTFKIEGPKEIQFDNSNTKEYAQKAKQYNSELDKTIKQFGLNDKSKLEDYKRAWWNKELDNQGIKFSKQEKQGLIKRFADDDKTFGSKSFDDDKKREWFKNYETNQLAKSQKKMINPIEMVFLNSGAQVLKRVNNFLSDDTKSKNALKKDTLESIKGIKNSKDPDKIAKLQKELQRLNAIGMDNVVPSEGVVFQYKGHPYKFTGAFAPINQINGTFKFDKPKKKELTPTNGNEPKKENPKNTVAIFSGRFQPFHAGHYSIYKSLVDKFGKDNVYIASSNSMDDVKSPFNFRDKKNIMTTMFGIPTNKVVQVKNPYAPTEILDRLPKDTKYVTAVSQKDAERLEKGGKYFKNYDKIPDNKKKSYKDEGYFIVAPEMQLKVNGKNISGTQLRATFGSDSVTLPEKKKIFQQIYPKFDKDVFAKIVVTTKKSEKIKKGTESKPKQADTKKQLSPDVLNKNPKVRKLLSTTIKNPETGRMIKVSSALRYDKKSKVRQNVDRMIKQQLKK